MRTNMKFWPAKRMLCLALCILMLVGIAVPSTDAFTWAGRESLLGRLFGVTEALAAPADGATIDESGTYGTCSYDIYSDGTMVIRPTSGTTGTWGSYVEDGDIPWSGNSAITSIEFRGTIRPTTCEAAFAGLYSLESIDFTGFDTSNVASMYSMFSGCEALTSLDVSGFDTANVTQMNYMFWGCSSLTNLDLSNFNTTKATIMSDMFSHCFSLTTIKAPKDMANQTTDLPSVR